MYEALSFRSYNSYSPRTGMSIPGSCRWALTVSAAICVGIGVDVIYGDTDSVMYTTDFDPISTSPISPYLHHFKNMHMNASDYQLCEYMSGGTTCSGLTHVHKSNTFLNGLLNNVINSVVAFTCFTTLQMEQQVAIKGKRAQACSYVFPSFIVISKKHYGGFKANNDVYTKSLLYVHRTGIRIGAESLEEFVGIVLREKDIDEAKMSLSRMCAEYKWKIKSHEYRHLLDINITQAGVRGTYIKVLPTSGNNVSYELSEELTDAYIVDIDYYKNSMRKSLECVSAAIGMLDCDAILSGRLMRNGWCHITRR
jgi:DNA polymerase elongation subunit (family B)